MPGTPFPQMPDEVRRATELELDRLRGSAPKLPEAATSETALLAHARDLYIEDVERIVKRAQEKGVSNVDVRIIDAAMEIMGRKVPASH